MKYRLWLKIILFFIIFSLTSLFLAIAFGALELSSLERSANAEIKGYQTVIIDAGHGGEDGGASSKAGLVEKDVNLEIALALRDMLKEKGINVIMTREDDRLLYDRNTNYQGRKKKLDLAARLAIADSTPDAIFISIHMNSFTDPKYSGLQVWYSQNDPNSLPLAELIRKENQKTLQPDNNRKTKVATSNINLLYNAKCPAVLVECGFLSNIDEASLFETQDYRRKVAFAISCAVCEFLNSNDSNA